MSVTNNLRGNYPYLPSWLLECGGNPKLNDVLDNIDSWGSGIEVNINAIFTSLATVSGDFYLLQDTTLPNLESSISGDIYNITNNIIPNLELNDLADVDTGTLSSNEVLTWNGTEWTNQPAGTASPLTTKGDIYTFDTDNQRLALGTNGQILSVDTSTPTGLKWEDYEILASNSLVNNEIPTGTVNGTNATFTTSNPYITTTLSVYRDGQRMNIGASNDYVETDPAAGTFTFSTPPVTGTIISVSYFQSGIPLGNADTLDGFNASITPTANTIPVLDENALLPPSAGGVPTGTVFPYAGLSNPTGGYLICGGQAVSRTTYAGLFAVIGTTYGVGDGSTTFNIPNLQGRIPVGQDESDGSFWQLGLTGGAKTHTLTSAESGLPAHTHLQNVTTTNNNLAPYYPTITSRGDAVLGNSGSTAANNAANASSAHNNLQPYIVLNYIIKT